MNTKLLITIALVCLVAADKETYIWQQFQKFLKENNKEYPTIGEYFARFMTFKENYEKIESMTLDPDSGISHRLGVTKYMDMTPEEFKRVYLTLKISPSNLTNLDHQFLSYRADAAPDALDWREKGAVGKVKDQGSCGSCWAFSTVGNLEGLHAIKTGQMVQYSEQQLVDCDKVDEGCNGGLMENAFNYLKEAGGIELGTDYPYHARGEKCQFNKDKVVLKVTGDVVKNEMDEGEMKEMLFSTGPLAIALNADTLQFYDGGVIDASTDDCDPQGLNHGVTLVGYGSENGKDFWIVKNSWGTNWGEKGYFRMTRGKGTCGINRYVSTATIE
jgi:cathepsin F